MMTADHTVITDAQIREIAKSMVHRKYPLVFARAIEAAVLAQQKKGTAAIPLSASANSPAHVSVGAVILGPEGRHVVHRRSNGTHSYMTETVEPGEALTTAVARGAMEEMGMGVAPLRYLGSTVHSGLMGRHYSWQKTTLWFECRLLADYGKRDDELECDIVFVDPSENLVWDEVRTPFALAAQKAGDGDAEDAARYRAWRNAAVTNHTPFVRAMRDTLPPEAREGKPRWPTEAEWDAAIDAAMLQQSKEKQ